MYNLKALLEKREGFVAGMQTLITKAETETRDFSADELTSFNAIKGDLAKCDADIQIAKTMEDAIRTAPVVLRPASTPTTPVDIASTEPEKFQSSGEFYQAVMRAGAHGLNRNLDPRLVPQGAASGQNVSVPSEGGFLVPMQFSNKIWEADGFPELNLASMTDIWTVPGLGGITIPMEEQVSRKDGYRHAGVSAYWQAEADQYTTSKAKFSQANLHHHKLGVMVYMTDEMMNQTPTAIEQFVDRKAGQAINWKMNDGIINGDGVGKPLGILNSAALVTVAKKAAQAADTIVAENITSMYSRLLPNSKMNGLWLVSSEAWEQIPLLALANTQISYSAPGEFRDAPIPRLQGLRVLETEFNSALGDVGDIMLADLRKYATLRQGNTKKDMSIHVRFDYGETAFRFTYYGDGQSLLKSSIAPYKGNKDRSAFITLAARA